MLPESFTLEKTLVFLLAIHLPHVSANKASGKLIPKEECDKISGVEVRYNEFYELYLGHGTENDEIQKHGIIYRSLSKGVEACCPGMELNFTLVNESIEHLVQEDILHHHAVQNDSKLVFYFPEFTIANKLEIYSHQIPFLKLRRSPGFALIMLKSDSHLNISPIDVLKPSWQIFVLVLLLSWAFGILVWTLEHRSNSQEFPKPFVRGMFEGFWWGIVTMTTVGYGDKAPKSFVGRVACVLWILVGAILVSLFTANTTSIITESRFRKNSQTMGKKIGVVNMKQFVEEQLNLGAQIVEFTHVGNALDALAQKTIHRLLFPHYLDLLYILSDPYQPVSLPFGIYIADEFDMSFQIGMVLSHAEAKVLTNSDFYTCLEIMTARTSAQYNYDYSVIDGSIIDENRNTFDTEVALKYLFGILGILGFMLIIGVAFDIYNFLKKEDKATTDGTEMHELRSHTTA